MNTFVTVLITSINHLAATFGRIAARLFFAPQWRLLKELLLTNKSLVESSVPSDLGHLPAALIACEDKRFHSHRGVDTYSIGRALFRATTRRSTEGASTITQQLVRVYSGDYRYSVGRKFKEIALATLADELLTKNEQIRLYLYKAYFGWKMNGLNQAAHRLGYTAPFSEADAAEIVARLKYPEPHNPSDARRSQIKARVNHILELTKEGCSST
jgi:penicillin-binding protein 1A